MIKLRRITDPNDACLAHLITLYKEAFPAEERRNTEQLKHLIRVKPGMYFNVIEYEGELAGLFVYWDFEGFFYLEHLAVFPEIRNKKIGQKVLDFFDRNFDGIRLLEVEPTEDEMSTRRVNFYKRNGYEVLDTEYVQPSYDGVRQSIPLWIMGNKNYPDRELLKKHVNTIVEEVYLKNYDPVCAK